MNSLAESVLNPGTMARIREFSTDRFCRLNTTHLPSNLPRIWAVTSWPTADSTSILAASRVLSVWIVSLRDTSVIVQDAPGANIAGEKVVVKYVLMSLLLCPRAGALGRCVVGLLDASHCIDGHLDLA